MGKGWSRAEWALWGSGLKKHRGEVAARGWTEKENLEKMENKADCSKQTVSEDRG